MVRLALGAVILMITVGALIGGLALLSPDPAERYALLAPPAAAPTWPRPDHPRPPCIVP